MRIEDKEAVGIDYEKECERMSMIIERQKEIIAALKKACFGMADALINDGEN